MDDGTSVDSRDSDLNVDAVKQPEEKGNGRATESQERALALPPVVEVNRYLVKSGWPGLELTKIPERGSVSHAIRMEALRERNAEMEFYCWAGIVLLMFVGFIFRRH